MALKKKMDPASFESFKKQLSKVGNRLVMSH